MHTDDEELYAYLDDRLTAEAKRRMGRLLLEDEQTIVRLRQIQNMRMLQHWVRESRDDH
ncbi:MAG: hypothetical protein JSW10_08870 [Pseudomonadota bacterium]|nr:MAG: hypothetical protein JSW10_08870 [Pseudomonadota bacterium]